MPSRMRLGPASSKVSCDRRSEVSHPAAHRLIGHHDAALSQQVLDIPEAEGKPGIEPDGRLNNHGWEAISGVADFAHDRHLWPQISAGKLNNVTMPLILDDRFHETCISWNLWIDGGFLVLRLAKRGA